MIFYNYSYILKTRKVYNQLCYYLDKCKVYRNSRQVSCEKCNQMTKSKYGFCDEYTKKYRAKEYYN